MQAASKQTCAYSCQMHVVSSGVLLDPKLGGHLQLLHDSCFGTWTNRNIPRMTLLSNLKRKIAVPNIIYIYGKLWGKYSQLKLHEANLYSSSWFLIRGMFSRCLEQTWEAASSVIIPFGKLDFEFSIFSYWSIATYSFVTFGCSSSVIILLLSCCLCHE